MIEPLFNPKSIAVVGASRDKEKVGNIVLRNVMSTFAGKIFPVNQSADTVEGIKAFKSIKDIGEVPDLAIIAVPREAVPGVMEMAGETGTKSAIIITSGFKEVDERGAELQSQIDLLASKYGIRYLGP
ncbi:MAG: CoA-binding protein, partial [Nitrososphaerota archaeon]|nr:CoA-binding protein [Nitrososphaerota archaeon]MDG6944517.1 CoA-binding protein [Nitrososphaerota archaeon]